MQYVGRRSDEGVEVTVDGKPLDPRFDLMRHSPDGFEYGYGGSGPAQLALALLAHHVKGVSPERLGELKRKAGWDGFESAPPTLENRTWPDYVALRFYQSFKVVAIARIPQASDFTLTSEQVDQALDALGAREQVSG